MDEDCHHCPHCNNAEVTWLSQSFYQCSQKQIVCEKSFSSQDSRVAGGRTHSPAFPYIALERALCSGKHQGQPTAGLALRLSTQRLPAWEDGAAAATSSSNNKQQPWNVNENWPIPNPCLLDVSCLACIFWVQQIQASDWLPFPSCSLMSICIIHKKKKRCTIPWGKVPLFSWSIRQILWWGQLLHNLYVYKIYLSFFHRGLGHTTKRVNPSYLLMSVYNGRKYKKWKPEELQGKEDSNVCQTELLHVDSELLYCVCTVLCIHLERHTEIYSAMWYVTHGT